MNTEDAEYIEEVEKEVEAIRKEALKTVRKSHPEIAFVVDRRTIDDYSMKTWDYPGKWYYMGFKLPDGYRSKEELIRDIAKDTVRYFTEKESFESHSRFSSMIGKARRMIEKTVTKRSSNK